VFVVGGFEVDVVMKKWRSRERGIDQENQENEQDAMGEMPIDELRMRGGDEGLEAQSGLSSSVIHSHSTPTGNLSMDDNNNVESSPRANILSFVRQFAQEYTSGQDQVPSVVAVQLEDDNIQGSSEISGGSGLDMNRSEDEAAGLNGEQAGVKKFRKKWKKPNQFTRMSYSPIPGKQPTTMGPAPPGAPKKQPMGALPISGSLPLSENNTGKKKEKPWTNFFKSRPKSLLDDKKNIDEANEEEISISESLEMQLKLKGYAQNNKVVWKRLAVTCCPAMKNRNRILDHKLARYGKNVVLTPMDMHPSWISPGVDGMGTDMSAGIGNQCEGIPRHVLSPANEAIDLNEDDFQEFDATSKPFDVYDLQQLVLVLCNPFSSVNIAADNGLCIAFVCPESSADEKNCVFNCDESFRSVRKSLGNWRCKAFSEFISTNCKVIRRKEVLNPIPFVYETWWFPDLIEALKLDKEVSLCAITPREVDNPEKPWLDGSDSILVSPLDRLERKISSVNTNLRSGLSSSHLANRRSSGDLSCGGTFYSAKG